MPSTRRELIFVAAAVLVLALLLELGLRATGIQFDASLYSADPKLGWSLRPNAEGWVVSEGRQYVRINSDALHDREHSLAKPKDVWRVAVLGNSWTEALQVPVAKNFTSVLERELSLCALPEGKKRAEVLNFGVSGYSTAQELLMLRDRVWKYQPDVVLLAFYTAKDVFNNVRTFNNAASPEQSPYFVYKRGKLVLDDSFRTLPQLQPRNIWLQELRGWITDHCRLLQTINSLIRSFKIRTVRKSQAEHAGGSRLTTIDDSIYSPPARPELEEAWNITQDLLIAMRDEVETHHAEFAIVTLANRPQVEPDVLTRSAYIQRLGAANLDYPDVRLRRFATQNGILIINLAPDLFAYARAHHTFLNGFANTALGAGHWNELGHELAGQAISRHYCRQSSPSVTASAGMQ